MQIHVGQETRIFTMERLGMYLIIDLAARGFRAFTGSDGLLYLSHPAITFLTRYDEENDNNLRLLVAYSSAFLTSGLARASLSRLLNQITWVSPMSL